MKGDALEFTQVKCGTYSIGRNTLRGRVVLVHRVLCAVHARERTNDHASTNFGTCRDRLGETMSPRDMNDIGRITHKKYHS